jgi:hypothetical protein
VIKTIVDRLGGNPVAVQIRLDRSAIFKALST